MTSGTPDKTSRSGAFRWRTSYYLLIPLFLFFVLPFLYHEGIGPLLGANRLYYRVRVELEYQGQPVKLDAVVKCAVHYTRPLGGARNVEFTYEPDFYGVRLPDGSGAFIKVGTGTDCFWAYKKDQGGRDLARLGWTQADILTGFPTSYWVSDFVKQEYAEVHFSQYSYTTPTARFRLHGNGQLTLATGKDYAAFTQRVEQNAQTEMQGNYRDHLRRNQELPLTNLASIYAVRLPASIWRPVVPDIPQLMTSIADSQLAVVSGMDLVQKVATSLYPLTQYEETSPFRQRRLVEYVRGQGYPALRRAIPPLEKIAAYVYPVSYTSTKPGEVQITSDDSRSGIASSFRVRSSANVASFLINGKNVTGLLTQEIGHWPILLDKTNLELIWFYGIY